MTSPGGGGGRSPALGGRGHLKQGPDEDPLPRQAEGVIAPSLGSGRLVDSRGLVSPGAYHAPFVSGRGPAALSF